MTINEICFLSPPCLIVPCFCFMNAHSSQISLRIAIFKPFFCLLNCFLMSHFLLVYLVHSHSGCCNFSSVCWLLIFLLYWSMKPELIFLASWCALLPPLLLMCICFPLKSSLIFLGYFKFLHKLEDGPHKAASPRLHSLPIFQKFVFTPL